MTTSFHNLGLSETFVQQLENIGFTTPTNIQAQAIPEMLQGRDIVAQSQTGTGKTAAFSLPILEQIDPQNKTVQALILSPTRELAQQVAKAIEDFSAHRRLYVLTVCGGQSMDRQIRSLQRGVHIVVGTPGRVIDLIERKKLNLEQTKWAVLDEADEMLSMGFIDDVKQILSQFQGERQTACFSATMPRQIRDLVKQFLNNPVNVTVEQPKAAPARITQNVYFVPRGWSKTKVLLPILEMENPQTAIIFVRTKKTAADLTAHLQEAGQSVDEYHGNLSQGQRERLVHRFRKGKIKIVVATDIAARGLDVEDLSHVINYDLPDNSETYIHRIGRTGRAGKEGVAISLVQPIDRRMLNQIERRQRQKLNICQVPDRAQVEGKRLNRLQSELKEALAGERMASFLPIVKELNEEYDPHAIAAAALQMMYDSNCPEWMQSDWDVPKVSKTGLPKPSKSGRKSYKGGRKSGSKSSNYSKNKKPIINKSR